MHIKILKAHGDYAEGATYDVPATVGRSLLADGKGALVPKAAKSKLTALKGTEPVKAGKSKAE